MTMAFRLGLNTAWLRAYPSSLCQTGAFQIQGEVIVSETMEVNLLHADDEARHEFRQGLYRMSADLDRKRGPRAWIAGWKVEKVLSDDQLFEKAFAKSQASFSADMAAKGLDVTKAERGDLFKWWLEWLQDGGWETILQIIMDLVKLFG